MKVNTKLATIANEKVLIRYIRNNAREKIGLILATCKGDEILIGYSKVHTYMDNFDKEKAIQIAVGRAFKHYERNYEKFNPPHSMIPELKNMVERSERYYKGKSVPEKVMNVINMYA